MGVIVRHTAHAECSSCGGCIVCGAGVPVAFGIAIAFTIHGAA